MIEVTHNWTHDPAYNDMYCESGVRLNDTWAKTVDSAFPWRIHWNMCLGECCIEVDDDG